ncbi:MAG: sigma-54-dependent Fis family transcriptional regulator [Deltaproteobacteria bacterium]|nr:sigma-54-dependent Fis family transcriptional regulator [Deltaproteobacteria bacterium]
MTNLAIDYSNWQDTDSRLEEKPSISISSQPCSFMGMIGQSERMQRIFRLVEKVADSDSTIIIQGETGTGKGLIAKAIHENSYRKDKPFVQINCGAIPENLLESELFGHVKGAFTGAVAAKPGKFEIANGGTIFLDEIGDMSHDLQVKLLKVLEDSEFERVGGCQTIKTDVRIIAATHRDLEAAVENGTFREDLYYRLVVIPLTLPPLRDRKSDIPLLISHFLNQLNQKKRTQVTGISEKTMELMIAHSWPGNVRELKNMMERLVVLTQEGEIYPRDLPLKLRTAPADTSAISDVEVSDQGICLSTAVSDFEKSLISQSMKIANGVKKNAAKLLNIKRTTLIEKIKRHNLEENFA